MDLPAHQKLVLVTYVKNYPGRFEKLNEVRNKLKSADGSRIILSYNSKEFNPDRVEIHINLITSQKDEKNGVKYFMDVVNSCEEMFRIKTYKSPSKKVTSWSSLFTTPYPNTSEITTLDELIACKTPDHNIYFL